MDQEGPCPPALWAPPSTHHQGRTCFLPWRATLPLQCCAQPLIYRKSWDWGCSSRVQWGHLTVTCLPRDSWHITTYHPSYVRNQRESSEGRYRWRPQRCLKQLPQNEQRADPDLIRYSRLTTCAEIQLNMKQCYWKNFFTSKQMLLRF